MQAIYAFARGGLLGEGLGQGLPLVDGRLPIPAVHTDMIFAAIGEELGLLGGVAMLGLVAVIMTRGLRIAVLARDDFSTMLATGLAAGLVLQSLIIMGGNLKVVPLTGDHPALRQLRRLQPSASSCGGPGCCCPISHTDPIEPRPAERPKSPRIRAQTREWPAG